MTNHGLEAESTQQTLASRHEVSHATAVSGLLPLVSLGLLLLMQQQQGLPTTASGTHDSTYSTPLQPAGTYAALDEALAAVHNILLVDTVELPQEARAILDAQRWDLYLS